MSQLTIYLEDSLEQKVRERAKLEGLSVSRWIAKAIETKEHDVWPPDVLAAFGSWNDFPDAPELRRSMGADARREQLD